MPDEGHRQHRHQEQTQTEAHGQTFVDDLDHKSKQIRRPTALEEGMQVSRYPGPPPFGRLMEPSCVDQNRSHRWQQKKRRRRQSFPSFGPLARSFQAMTGIGRC